MDCAISAILKGDQRRRTEEADEEVKRLPGLDSPLHQEAWHRMKGWYRDAVDPAPPPAWVKLERITAERVDLYQYIPHSGKNIPISVEPFLV